MYKQNMMTARALLKYVTRMRVVSVALMHVIYDCV